MLLEPGAPLQQRGEALPVLRLSASRREGLDPLRPLLFAELRRIAERIRSLGLSGVAMEELSMGMTGDFEAAIAEGATLVRVGTAIFGGRA